MSWLRSRNFRNVCQSDSNRLDRGDQKPKKSPSESKSYWKETVSSLIAESSCVNMLVLLMLYRKGKPLPSCEIGSGTWPWRRFSIWENFLDFWRVIASQYSNDHFHHRTTWTTHHYAGTWFRKQRHRQCFPHNKRASNIGKLPSATDHLESNKTEGRRKFWFSSPSAASLDHAMTLLMVDIKSCGCSLILFFGSNLIAQTFCFCIPEWFRWKGRNQN